LTAERTKTIGVKKVGRGCGDGTWGKRRKFSGKAKEKNLEMAKREKRYKGNKGIKEKK